MEIAQEEVLTCIGMCIYNRLKKIHQCVKEEENACQILAAVAVHALSRSFDVAVENKRGVNLDEMFNELSREERLREEKKIKKTKKRKKRSEKKQKDDDDDTFNCEPEPVPEKCDCNDDDDHDHSEDEDIHSDNDEDKIVLCDGTVIDVGLAPSRGKTSKPHTPVKSRLQATRELSEDRSRSTSVEHLEVKVDDVSITSCQSCHENEGICAQQSIDAGYLSETHHEGLQSNNASSRTSSIVR